MEELEIGYIKRILKSLGKYYNFKVSNYTINYCNQSTIETTYIALKKRNTKIRLFFEYINNDLHIYQTFTTYKNCLITIQNLPIIDPQFALKFKHAITPIIRQKLRI